MEIRKLKVNHIENPVGYCLDHLHLTWKVTNVHAKTDTWTRVLIAEDMDFSKIILDTGKMAETGRSYYDAEIKRQPYTRYYWKVIIQAGDEYSESKISFFETAKEQEDWDAEWIGIVEEQETMPFIYRTFMVNKKVKKARLYCTGYGLYELYLDKCKQGEEYLLPGYHAYDLMQEYQTYDLTELLTIGNHTIGFLLGDGWYKGRFVFDGGYRNLYGSQKMTIGELHIVYVDDTEEIIGTDACWKAKETPIMENGIYDGETIDFTRECRSLEVKEITCGKNLLVARMNPPIHAVETFPVKELIKTPKGEWVLDFGESVTGWTEFVLSDNCGEEISLTYGEILQEGNFYNDNLRTAKAEFRIRGKVQGKVRPHFTYYGFRYVKVEGIRKPEPRNFTAVRLMSDIPVTGHITTGIEKVNRLIENSLRSQKCNFLDIPTDCPQRDERMGWTGDIAVYAQTACFHMETAAFLNHYMMNLIREQQLTDGAVPFFVPRPKPERHDGINPFLVTEGASVWGDAAAIIPWKLYEHYQDKKMLQLHYESMCSWVNYVTKRSNENEVPYLWQNDRQLGDWLALDNGDLHNPIGLTDPQLIASAYYYHSVELCEKAAEVLNVETERKKWQELKRNIKAAFIAEYLKEDGELKSEQTQTSYILILYFGLYHENQKSVLKKGLKNSIEKYGYHLSTGFAGTHLLCPALSDNGMNEVAYTLLLNEDYPGWLHEVNLGATTVWERWNSIGVDGKISPDGMNSLNHYAYGSVVGWIYQYVCGFRLDKDGALVIRPMPDARLKSADGMIETVYGICRSKWEYHEDQSISYLFDIPFQAKIKVVLPNGDEHLLESGIHMINTIN